MSNYRQDQLLDPQPFSEEKSTGLVRGRIVVRNECFSLIDFEPQISVFYTQRVCSKTRKTTGNLAKQDTNTYPWIIQNNSWKWTKITPGLALTENTHNIARIYTEIYIGDKQHMARVAQKQMTKCAKHIPDLHSQKQITKCPKHIPDLHWTNNRLIWQIILPHSLCQINPVYPTAGI